MGARLVRRSTCGASSLAARRDIAEKNPPSIPSGLNPDIDDLFVHYVGYHPTIIINHFKIKQL